MVSICHSAVFFDLSIQKRKRKQKVKKIMEWQIETIDAMFKSMQ